MPNYVTNIIKMVGDEKKFKDVFHYIGTDEYGEKQIDFNKIIPMPESLNVTAGSMEDQSVAVYKSKFLNDHNSIEKMLNYPWVKQLNIVNVEELCNYLIEKNPNILDLGKQYITNIKLYGHSSWYGWCIENWGVKWNAGDSWVAGDSFGFNTAWNDVGNLISIISSKFPDIIFEYKYADEDFGSNLGKITFKAGKIINSYIPKDGSDEAMNLAKEILGYDYYEEE